MDARKLLTGGGAAGTAVRWGLLTAAVMALLLYAPTPYAAYEPGLAFYTKPLVRASNPDEPGTGAFMLTTVQLSDANAWKTIRSSWDGNLELVRKRDLFQGGSQADFMEMQTVVMRGSQTDAVEAAYEEAGVAYEIASYALVVSDAGSSSGAFHTGDEIVSFGGLPVTSLRELSLALNREAAAGQTQVSIVRQGRTLELAIRLPAEVIADQPALMVGVRKLTELRRIQPANAEDEVDIQAGEIGGPSAGLMFALQTLDELTDGDLTAGMRVAGTGTINAKGEVGAIGGVSHKVVAADRAGADVFLVPEENEQEAIAKAADIGTAMRVLGIGTLREAKQALEEAGG
ncbi:YlbL family protein [Paenibacillus methanolicus]|uniref:endopeptidase La n=1 Tax=Paenibacillus methanolicus TaxID=582686 RepID=A0A5S5CHJ7_9BACL|nr:S16 family serine protease [Paenibacillus methanolicus]TYP77696.1 PDZ domain-containing protein [Paenibacillus methanolicus]